MLEASDFFSDFECAYLDGLRKVSPNAFTMRTQSREAYGQQGSLNIWVCGGIRPGGSSASARDAVTIRIPNGNQGADLIPCYSLDRRSWHPVPQRRSSFDFDIPLPTGPDRIYFATTYPYTYSQAVEHALSLSQSPHAEVEVLGRSEGGRDIHLVTIGDDGSDPGRGTGTKRRVFVQTGLHGGETASIYAVEGMMDFLASDDAEAARIRREMILRIVPMLNVDAQYLGLDRRNLKGINLFYDWGPGGTRDRTGDPSIPGGDFTQAETRLIRDAVMAWEPDAFLDIHSWHFAGDGFWGPDPVPSSKEVEELRSGISRHFRPQHIFQKGAITNPASAVAVMLSIPAATPELAMGFDSDGHPKTPDTMREQGIQILRGVHDYFHARKA